MAVEIPQNDQLRKFTLAKQQVGELLHASLQLFNMHKDEPGVDQSRELLAKLAEDRFNLAVVGQFKRGKSSLMNAIIGRDILPTGLLPLTSAITTLCYGPQEKVILKRSGWSLEQEIGISELPEYVTEQGNPGNTKGLLEARVEIPVPFLRRGLFFVDTPGIGSTRSENTATTYSFLPNTDAVIFVTSVEAPLSEPEETFLRDVQQYARRLFIVVNKVDLLDDQESEEILNYIRTGISSILGRADIRLYPLSARLALKSKLSDDHGNHHQDGLGAFEVDLEKFLTEEKSQLFLVSLLDRLLRIFAEGTARLQTREVDQAKLLQLVASTQSLRDSLLNGIEAFSELKEAPSRSRQEIETFVFSSVRRQPTALKTRTCPICAALSQTLFDFFAQYQSKLALEGEVRQAFIGSKGFCQVHTWQFELLASPQGISEGYVNMVEKIASDLHVAAGLSPLQSIPIIENLLPDGDHCLACRLLRGEEANQVKRFLEYVATPDGQEYYRQSLGLCLSHLQAVLADEPPKAMVEFLLTEQARHFEELSEDMRAYTLKRDAIRRYLLNGNEENAWRRVLVQIVGERTAHIEPLKQTH